MNNKPSSGSAVFRVAGETLINYSQHLVERCYERRKLSFARARVCLSVLISGHQTDLLKLLADDLRRGAWVVNRHFRLRSCSVIKLLLRLFRRCVLLCTHVHASKLALLCISSERAYLTPPCNSSKLISAIEAPKLYFCCWFVTSF